MAESTTRRSERIYIRMLIEVTIDSEGSLRYYPASTIDFSPLGARVQTEIALLPGSRVNFIWRGATPQSFPSEVIWSAQGRMEQGHEAGLQFLQPIALNA
jgi:hypothetical protein